MDETHIEVDGRWRYLYRAIDSRGARMEVLLSERCDMAAARAFFRSAWVATGTTPDRATTDGHGSYPRALRTELCESVRHRTSRYYDELRKFPPPSLPPHQFVPATRRRQVRLRRVGVVPSILQAA